MAVSSRNKIVLAAALGLLGYPTPLSESEFSQINSQAQVNLTRQVAPISQSVSLASTNGSRTKPNMPDHLSGVYYHKTDTHEIQYYHFCLGSIDCDIELEKVPMHVEQITGHLLRLYGGRLEFIAGFGYFSLKDSQMVGRIVRGHRLVAKGRYDGGVFVVNRDSSLEVSSCLEADVESSYWATGGFPSLVRNYHPDLGETVKRHIDFSDHEKKRIALAVYPGCDRAFVFYTGPIDSFASVMASEGVRDAVLLDGGDSRFFAKRDRDGKFQIWKHPERKLRSVVYGLRNADQ